MSSTAGPSVTVTFGSGHCCVCAGFCYHIGGPHYCSQHDWRTARPTADGPIRWVNPPDHQPPPFRQEDEVGHACPFCPVVVRNLAAVAHNAAGAIRAALDGGGGWDRARRKLAELEQVVRAVEGRMHAEHWSAQAQSLDPRRCPSCGTRHPSSHNPCAH